MKKITYIALLASILLMIVVGFVKINHYAGFHTLWAVSVFVFFLLFALILIQIGLKVVEKVIKLNSKI